jgi:thiol-disulfide isomerase/thioredoxin
MFDDQFSIILIIIVVIYLLYHGCKKYNTTMSARGITIIWFYRPGCGWCERMESEWDDFVSKAPNNININRVNIIENQQMAQDFQVEGVPHIVKIVNGSRHVFNEERTCDNFLRFVSS